MRISKGRRGWLPVAAAAWALGTARADSVFFDPTQPAFKGDSVQTRGYAIFTYQNFYSHTFVFNVTGVTVDEVLLCTNDTGTPRQLGSAPIAQQGISGTSPNQVTTTTPTTTSSSSDPRLSPSTTALGSGAGGGNLGTGGRQITARGTGNLTLTVTPYPNGGGVGLNGNIEPIDALASAVPPGIPLFFQVQGSYGKSYSRLFSLVNTDADITALIHSSSVSYDSLSPYRAEQPASTQPESPAATSQTPNTTNGGGDQSDGNLGNSGSSGAASTNSSSSSSGLSTGAIAGIAVACGVVGLLLVAAAVWYLLRRRQQHQALLAEGGAGAYGAGKKNRRAETLMAEKEAGADVDVSPHSPYSDDGASGGGGGQGPSGSYHHHQDGSSYVGEAAAAAVAGGAAATALHHHHSYQQQQQQHPLQDQHASRSYTPYSDDHDLAGPGGGTINTLTGTPSLRAASLAPAQQTDEAAPRVSVPSATPGRATPRALTTPYAHLVEEGMTEDEIRRLEEEERQLDVAIERAGAGRR